jgi:hypothetical protein
MSETGKPEDRPAQVTVAAWLIMVGSVFVVLTVWDKIAGLHTMQSQKALQKLLDQTSAKGVDVDLGTLMTIIKTLSMVAAGCATAMAILGYQTLQRSRSARLLLTILAVPLFVTGLAIGGFLSSAVAASVATLWLRPARLWFGSNASSSPSIAAFTGGQPEVTQLPRVSPPQQAPMPPPQQAPMPPQAAVGPTYPQPSSTPFGQAPPTPPYGQPVVPYAPQPYAVRRDPAAPRPPAVIWACLRTWLFCSLTALLVLGSIAVMSSNSALVLDKMHAQNPELAQQGFSDHVILTIMYALCALLVVWVVAAAVVAILVFRRVRWAWWALVVSTVATIAVSFLSVLGSVAMLVPLAGAAATLSMLLRPEVRRWLA